MCAGISSLICAYVGSPCLVECSQISIICVGSKTRACIKRCILALACEGICTEGGFEA